MPFLKKERSKKSDGEHKASGRKMRRRKVNGIKFMMNYLSKVREVDKKLSRFNLSYLENQVFSWSVDDVFNRDLFREKVTTIS
jgi:senataxin